MLNLPPGFVSIKDAYDTKDENKLLNVIAVVVDNLPIAKARDWMCKVTLQDHSGFEGLGAPFRFFNADRERLPVIDDNGDVLIIRSMKVKPWNGTLGMTNPGTTWVLIDGVSLGVSTDKNVGGIKYKKSLTAAFPTSAELLYAKELREMTDPSTLQLPAKPTALQVATIMNASGGAAPPPKDKFSLVKDILPPSTYGELIFKDILGEVRRIHKTDTRVEIYITDYTSHGLLYNYTYGHEDEGPDGDQFGYVVGASKSWPGPSGTKTIMITLWDAHSRFAHKELQEGHYVYLKNVHMKLDRNGAVLEGHCRGDKLNMAKVNVAIVKPVEVESNERLKALIRRKRATEKAEGPKFVRDPTNPKRSAEAIAEARNEEIVKGKTARNKKKRDKKRRGNAKATDAVEDSDENESKSKYDTGIHFSTNTEVRLLKCEVPPKPVNEILDREILARKTPKGNKFYLPFQNCKYKAQVRVVDFFPDNLANFAAPYRNSEYDVLSDQEDAESDVDMTQLDGPDVKWEWRFFLIVEDASQTAGQPPAQMELLVSDEEGDYLLDMEACDLRNNPRELARLKEKLFVLWGDLQELKEEASKSQPVEVLKPRSRPFQCLIKEYGIHARDENGAVEGIDKFERLFRLWGTTVK